MKRLIVALIALIALGSCRSSVTAPKSHSFSAFTKAGLQTRMIARIQEPGTDGDDVPRLVYIGGAVIGQRLVIVAVADRRSVLRPYSHGTWDMAIWLDVDQDKNTGYAIGNGTGDYIGAENMVMSWDGNDLGPGKRAVHTVNEGGGPGGWGPQVGVANLYEGQRWFTFSIPVSALHQTGESTHDDGYVDGAIGLAGMTTFSEYREYGFRVKRERRDPGRIPFENVEPVAVVE